MFSLKIGLELPLVGETTLYERTQSIIESVEFLWENNNRFVAFLILFFSVMIPVTKAVLLLLVLWLQALKSRYNVYRFVYAISKWSMADVFVVGVFIAYLSTESTDAISARLHDGFFYFVGYCLISIASVQVMKIESNY
jgi:uncharacterized paraquat-inducible protein A